MNELLKYAALIICVLGLIIWHVTIRLRDPQPAGFAETGKIMFAVGLLALLCFSRGT